MQRAEQAAAVTRGGDLPAAKHHVNLNKMNEPPPFYGKYRHWHERPGRMARISVIIPAYNAARTLDDCIESIERQTWADWEIVACDDASTDDTWEILKRWSKRDARITILRNGANRRAAAARNRCLELATGEYIALQDADDFSSPGRLARQLKFLETHREYAFVGAVMACFDEGGVRQKLEQKPEPAPRDFIWRMPFNHAAVMLRKSALDAVGGYRVAAETVRGQDLDLFMRLYAAEYRGFNLPDMLYYYNEGKENFARRKYRYRIDEARVKWMGYCAMGVMPLGILGVLKPLAVGLIPARLMRSLKRGHYAFRRRLRRGGRRGA
jgi:glycosyltransferase EpsE